MKTELTIHTRAFPVVIYDKRTDEARAEEIVLDKRQLQAAQLVGQSSKDLSHRPSGRGSRCWRSAFPPSAPSP